MTLQVIALRHKVKRHLDIALAKIRAAHLGLGMAPQPKGVVGIEEEVKSKSIVDLIGSCSCYG